MGPTATGASRRVLAHTVLHQRPLRRGRKQFTIDASSDYMPALDRQLQALLDTQIMNLLILAPDIQEKILFMPPVTSGDPPVTEKTLRPVLQTLVWSEQRERWAALRE